MSVLSNIMNQEQLSIRNCFGIWMDNWFKVISRHDISLMQEAIFDGLEKEYDGSDFMSEDFFPTIYNDIPRLMYDHLYEAGHITKASLDGLLCGTIRGMPYWGVPEVPQFSIPIITQYFNTTVNTNVINKIWENQWKGIDPIAYHKFIRYMATYWRSSLQFCNNPNPWEVLKDILANPQDYEYLM